MKIIKFLQSPLIRLIGVVAILYFALFFNKYDPESLGVRLAPERIKQEFQDAQDKSRFIITNIQTAKQLAKEKEGLQKADQSDYKLQTEDLENGSGEEKIICGDEAIISYGLYNKDGKQLQFMNMKKLFVGNRSDKILERNVIGMRQDGVRNIKVPRDFKNDDLQLMDTLKFNDGDLKYQVTILSFSHHPESKISCDNF